MRYEFHTTDKRSQLMRKIRGKDTTPEIIFRNLLWRSGIRYRKYDKSVLGQPDVTIRKHRIAIFIDGEFWHGYQWEEKKQRIIANKEYWIHKIERNMERDQSVSRQLEGQGWKVLRFWASDVTRNPQKYVEQILALVDAPRYNESNNHVE